MKNRFWTLVVISGLTVFASCTHGVVTERPPEFIYERPMAPGPDYVWVDGDWVYKNGRYNWHEGYWDHAKSGRQWQHGNWEQVNNGWRWRKGEWK